MRAESKTSWTTDQLRQLKEQTNHGVVFDGWDYWWYKFLDGEWCKQSGPFDTYAKPYSFMRFHLNRYNREYNQRLTKLIKRLESNIPIRDKILIAEELKPNLNNQQLANYLRVSTKTIQRNR